MPIKYAEIIIHRNLDNESIFSYIMKLWDDEPMVTDNDTLIISFDDNTICDVKQEYVDKKYEFGINSYQSKFPMYFEMNDKYNIFFLKHTYIDTVTGNRKLNFNNIFENYPKMLQSKKISSVNNTIYTHRDKEVFSIVKHRSNEKTQIYFMAYDDELFERSDLIYLVNCIFNKGTNIPL